MSKARTNHLLPDKITTDRLVLRAPNMADAPVLQHLANNWNIHKVLARLPHPYTREHAVDFITNLARNNNEHAYAIATANDDFVGVVGIHFGSDLGPELGYWIGETHWGKGYASEAAIAIVRSAKAKGISTISARSISSNKGSIGVLLKAGFLQTSKGIDDCGQHKGVSVTHFRWESVK